MFSNVLRIINFYFHLFYLKIKIRLTLADFLNGLKLKLFSQKYYCEKKCETLTNQ